MQYVWWYVWWRCESKNVLLIIYVHIHHYMLRSSDPCLEQTCMDDIAGGDTIRQLQVQCGAHIELHRGTHPDPSEKLFNIRGMLCVFNSNESKVN